MSLKHKKPSLQNLRLNYLTYAAKVSSLQQFKSFQIEEKKSPRPNNKTAIDYSKVQETSRSQVSEAKRQRSQSPFAKLKNQLNIQAPIAQTDRSDEIKKLEDDISQLSLSRRKDQAEYNEKMEVAFQINDYLKKQIENLKKQVETQKKSIDQLTKENLLSEKYQKQEANGKKHIFQKNEKNEKNERCDKCQTLESQRKQRNESLTQYQNTLLDLKAKLEKSLAKPIPEMISLPGVVYEISESNKAMKIESSILSNQLKKISVYLTELSQQKIQLKSLQIEKNIDQIENESILNPLKSIISISNSLKNLFSASNLYKKNQELTDQLNLKSDQLEKLKSLYSRVQNEKDTLQIQFNQRGNNFPDQKEVVTRKIDAQIKLPEPQPKNSEDKLKNKQLCNCNENKNESDVELIEKQKQQIESLTETINDLKQDISSYTENLSRERKHTTILREEVVKAKELNNEDLAYQQTEIEKLEDLVEKQMIENDELKLINQQLRAEQEKLKKQVDEPIYSKDDVLSNSSSSSSSSQNKEMIEQLESENQELLMKNHQLQEQIRDLQKQHEKATKGKVQKKKNFWHLEIEALGSSLISLVNDKWVFQFTNETEELQPYNTLVSLFSFDSTCLTQTLDDFFNGQGEKQQREYLYMKTMNQKKQVNKKVLKPYALMVKLLGHWESNSLQEVPINHQNDCDLNEFWLKYAFNEPNGIVFFISQSLSSEDLNCIIYMTSIQKDSYLIIHILNEKCDQSSLQLLVEQYKFNCENSNRAIFLDKYQLQSYLEQTIVEKQSKWPKEIIQQIRSFMEKESSYFFNQNKSNFNVAFDFQEVQNSQNKFNLRLILDNDEVKNYEINQLRENQFWIQDLVMYEIGHMNKDTNVKFKLIEDVKILKCEEKVIQTQSQESKLLVRIQFEMKGIQMEKAFVVYIGRVQTNLKVHKNIQSNSLELRIQRS